MVIAGIAWLAFGGYTNYGEDVWGRQLNYYLIPVMVSQSMFFTISTTCVFVVVLSPLQVLSFVAYLVAAGFTSVFLMAVDTVFICFCKFVYSYIFLII